MRAGWCPLISVTTGVVVAVLPGDGAVTQPAVALVGGLGADAERLGDLGPGAAVRHHLGDRHLSIVFQGGEPTSQSRDRFESLLSRRHAINGH